MVRFPTRSALSAPRAQGPWALSVLFLAAALLLLALPAVAEEGQKMFDPRFREGAPSDAIYVGPPRLSRGHLNAYVDMFEAAFDLALPAKVEQNLRDALEKSFEAGLPGEREALLATSDTIVALRRQARCCNWSGVRASLRQFRADVDKRLRGKPKSEVSRIIAYALHRRHEVVWLGEPEVKQLSADAYLEMALFLASLGRNEAIVLTPGQASALQDYLGGELCKLDCCCRKRLAAAHRIWLRIKARWDRGRDSRRLALRWEAVRLLARLVPKTGGMKICVGPDAKAYAREASKVAAADRAFDAVTGLARNPKPMMEAFMKGLALDPKCPPCTFMLR
jgi:hypothetical protein